jgi:glycosyltransferase involved in cell wall biosynthesis
MEGGVEAACFNLGSALHRSGAVEVTVLCVGIRYDGKPGVEVTQIDGLRVYRIGTPKGVARPIWVLYWAPKLINSLLLEEGIMLAHFQGSALWAGSCRVPTVLTIHGLNERDTMYRGIKLTRRLRWLANMALEAPARRRAPNVILISPYVKAFLGRMSDKRTWLIENAVADSFFTVHRCPQRFRILSVGRISRLKNTELLIKAFASLACHGSEWQLRLAGAGLDSAYGSSCRRLATAMGVGQRVHFLGGLTIPRLQEELSLASCMALCSLQEHAPLSISEAMASGVPVLASAVGGIPFMVKEGVTGRLVEPGSIASVRSGLMRLHYEDDLGTMGQAAKEYALARYKASEVGARTIAAYHEVMASPLVQRRIASI